MSVPEQFCEPVAAGPLDGKMVDVPVVDRARLLREREEAIGAREARMQSFVR